MVIKCKVEAKQEILVIFAMFVFYVKILLFNLQLKNNYPTVMFSISPSVKEIL